MTTAQAAAKLGVKTATIRQWIKRGLIPEAQKFGRDWNIPPEAVKRLASRDGKAGRPRRK